MTDRTRTWKAQLRVVEKQAPHTPKSVTTIQRLILADTKGFRIQATCFGDDIATFDALLHVHKSYYFSNDAIKRIEPRHRIVDNNIQTMLNSRLSIEEISGPIKEPTEEPYNFTKISSTSRFLETNIHFDIAAIVIHVLPGRTITKRMDGSSAQVRDLLLLDDSLHSIKLSAWDEFTSNECEQIASNITQQLTVIMTKLRATKFNGQCLDQRKNQCRSVNTTALVYCLQQMQSKYHRRHRNNIQLLRMQCRCMHSNTKR